jgi:hypothetical protein
MHYIITIKLIVNHKNAYIIRRNTQKGPGIAQRRRAWQIQRDIAQSLPASAAPRCSSNVSGFVIIVLGLFVIFALLPPSLTALEELFQILAQESAMPRQVPGDQLAVAAPVVDRPAGNSE